MQHIAEIIQKTIDITNQSTRLSLLVVCVGSILAGGISIAFLAYYSNRMQRMIGAMLIFEVRID